jgi:ribosomal protein L7/L12
MASDNFRTLAFALRNVAGLDTYGVLNAADAVEATVEGMVAQAVEDYRRENAAALAGQVIVQQNVLNRAASTLPEALEYFNLSKKILAIKVVRAEFGVGLKAAKDAVESAVFALAADATSPLSGPRTTTAWSLTAALTVTARHPSSPARRPSRWLSGSVSCWAAESKVLPFGAKPHLPPRG